MTVASTCVYASDQTCNNSPCHGKVYRDSSTVISSGRNRPSILPMICLPRIMARTACAMLTLGQAYWQWGLCVQRIDLTFGGNLAYMGSGPSA